MGQGTFWLSEAPGEVASRGWDAALPRVATWVRLIRRETGHEILWLNTHFDHRGERARRESAVLIHRWLATEAGAAAVVVTGDFNAPADATPDAVHQNLLRGPAPRPLLTDTWTEIHGSSAGPADTFHGFTGVPSRGRIDWALASPELPVLAAAVDRHHEGGRYPSDHFPVTATLGLPPRGDLARAQVFNRTLAGDATDQDLAAEQGRPTALRQGDWAARLAARSDLGYRFGLADGGYAAAGRLAPGGDHDCISLVYRVCELARARTVDHALSVALATRFAGAVAESPVLADGRVDYDHAAHLDYSVDMIRSGRWGGDVTARLTGARPDPLGSARYPALSVVTVPKAALDLAELRHGDVVWFVLSPDDQRAASLRRDHGLMVGHAGVVVRDGDAVQLVHAASRPLTGWYEAPGVVSVPWPSIWSGSDGTMPSS